MTQLVTRINNLSTAIATQIKGLKGYQGDLTTLNTTAKNTLVASLNELKAGVVALQNSTSIDDTSGSNTTTWSSNKIASSIAAKTEINDSAQTATNTWSATKVRSVVNSAVAAQTQISDTAVKTDANSTSVTWSVSKITDQITSAINALTSNAPAALDTLKELADSIGDDANFAATVTAALGNRIRYDAAQTLTTAQQAQVKTNIDALGTAEIGNPDTDFVATFTAGLS